MTDPTVRDYFYESALLALVQDGWTITQTHRYDPTIIEGTRPNGDPFRVEFSGNVATFTVKGVERTRAVSRTAWLEPEGVRVALMAERTR